MCGRHRGKLYNECTQYVASSAFSLSLYHGPSSPVHPYPSTHPHTHTRSHAHTLTHVHLPHLWPHLRDSAIRESRSPSRREGDFIEQHLPHDGWFGDVHVQARAALSAPPQGNGWDDTQDAAMRGCQIPVHLKCGGVREV